MGATNTGHIMTLANSIIGVGILAMPFCFQKCGIVLSIVLLILSNLSTRLCCHYLLKTSILTRKRTFEFLAFHIFGSSGKLMVELCVIGYLMGTCITYFVVLGDLGPQITAKLFNISLSDSLRTWVMIFVTIVCIIPLGLLKNIESLSHVCTTSIIFYFCLVIKVIAESETHITSGDWYQSILLWQPAGILQCLPIFSMALSCQINIFEVYDSLPNPSLQKMNEIVKSATAICTGVYILVGFFGYVAFSSQTFSGNIMLNFSQSLASDIIKMGFVLSVACSFPLMIFPCRATLYSLIYRRSHSDAAQYIPEHRFKYITISMIITALLIGVMIPSIELVIGLVGSTIGVAICVMFPASCFVKCTKKNSTEKLLAQVILICGFLIMILGTYANLVAIDAKQSGADLEPPGPLQAVPDLLPLQLKKIPKLPETLNVVTVKPINDNPIESNIKEPNAILNEKQPADQLNEIKEPNSLREINLTETKRAENRAPPAQAVKPIENEKVIKVKSMEPVVQIKQPEAILSGASKPESVINKDAIQKEDQEIAIADKENAGKELKQTKELLEQVKDELEKQNKETQKLVLEKIEKISEKVDKIGKTQDETKGSQLSGGTVDNKLDNKKPIEPMPNTVVKLLLDPKRNMTNMAYETDGQNKEPPAVAPVNKEPLLGVGPAPSAADPSPLIENKVININPVPNSEPLGSRTIEKIDERQPNGDAKQRDLLGLKAATAEELPPMGQDSLKEREKREIPLVVPHNKESHQKSMEQNAPLKDGEKREIPPIAPHNNISQTHHKSNEQNSTDSLPIIHDNRDAAKILEEKLIPKTQHDVLPSDDRKIFVRDLKSINDTISTTRTGI